MGKEDGLPSRSTQSIQEEMHVESATWAISGSETTTAVMVIPVGQNETERDVMDMLCGWVEFLNAGTGACMYTCVRGGPDTWGQEVDRRPSLESGPSGCLTGRPGFVMECK
eukprot:GHVU01203308.1.p4 GENE.GHVU01203308.1~~GHVU01203308.1.p4  ORF type:complete len:111 (+),score=7.52 GHVU01203308.1:807-1139(+)